MQAFKLSYMKKTILNDAQMSDIWLIVNLIKWEFLWGLIYVIKTTPF